MSKVLELTVVQCNKMLRFAYTFQGLAEVTLETKARCPRRVNGLFLVERFVNRDGATFAYLECPLCRLKSIEPQRCPVEVPSTMISAPFGTEFTCAQATRLADFWLSGTLNCVWILSLTWMPPA